jgi:hypothetical protein
MAEDSDRRDYENQRENDPAVTINSFRLLDQHRKKDKKRKMDSLHEIAKSCSWAADHRQKKGEKGNQKTE